MLAFPNFFVVPTISLAENAGSDRSWVWQCHDYSEGRDGTTETQYSTLAIRFANSENAQKFKEAFEEAKELNKGLNFSSEGESTVAAPEKAEAKEAPKEGAKEEKKEVPAPAEKDGAAEKKEAVEVS